ncbi:hypothetical protein E2C01_039769 [Portunus trituberculatus]|uniref:Uncharacterized protein n=1 Tax=Portunus trituberculatus TaxID=210409 RepID=A0A5B7FEM8_PORTR|nr:hypothetical protein [Portunus trituberculatus]
MEMRLDCTLQRLKSGHKAGGIGGKENEAVVPTIPVSWGSVSASPVGAVNSDGTPAQLQSSLAPPPVSIHTLDKLVKQGSKVSDAFTSPPKACELPTPDLFTQVHPPDIPHAGIVNYSGEQKTTCREEGSTDNWNTNNVSGKAEVSLASALPKLHTKRRIAAQFTSK